MDINASNVIVSRDLTFLHLDGKKTQGFVRIMEPLEKEKSCWMCEVQISNGIEKDTRGIYGVDPFQALQLTFRYLTTHPIETLNRQWNGTFQWEGQPFEL